MKGASYRLDIDAGSTLSLDIECQDERGRFLDLTGYEARMQLRRMHSAPTAELSLDSDALGGLSIGQSSRVVAFVGLEGYAVNVYSEQHNLVAGEAVKFTTTGTLPSGLATGTTYYVVSAGMTPYSVQVAETKGGTPISYTGAGTGEHTLTVVAPGVVQLRVEPDVTSGLSGSYVYDVELTAPSGEVYRVCQGAAVVSPEVTI